MRRGRRRKPKPPIPILNVSMVCPASGMRYVDQASGKLREIKPHYAVVRMCRTERGLFFVCQTHSVRGFLTDPVLVDDVKRSEELNAATSA